MLRVAETGEEKVLTVLLSMLWSRMNDRVVNCWVMATCCQVPSVARREETRSTEEVAGEVQTRAPEDLRSLNTA